MQKLLGILFLAVYLSGCGSDQSNNQNQSKQSTAQSRLSSTGTPRDLALEAKKKELLQTGMDQLNQTDVNEAIKTFGEVIKLDPRDTRAYFILVQTYIRLQNFENASNVLDSIIKIDPNNGQAFYLKAITSGFLGQRDIALIAAQKSAEIFQIQRDEENFKKSLALVQSLTASLAEEAGGGQTSAGNVIIDPKEISSNLDVHQDLANDMELNPASKASR